MGGPDVHCRGLQREPLERAAHLDPVRLVVEIRGEYRDAGGASNLPRVFVVLGVFGKEGVEHQTAEPAGNHRVAGRACEEPVAQPRRLGAIEANPVLELADKRGIPHLHGVALHHEVEYRLHGPPVREQVCADAVSRAGRLQKLQLVLRKGLGVELRSRRLPAGYGLEQERSALRTAYERDIDRFLRPPGEDGIASISHRRRSLHEVLGRAPEADEEVVIVRVDDRASALVIGKDRNRLLPEPELPALGVVAGRGEACVAHELEQYCGGVAPDAFSMTPRLPHGILVFRAARVRGAQGEGSRGAQAARRGRRDERPSRHHCATSLCHPHRKLAPGTLTADGRSSTVCGHSPESSPYKSVSYAAPLATHRLRKVPSCTKPRERSSRIDATLLEFTSASSRRMPNEPNANAHMARSASRIRPRPHCARPRT
uniref:Uncharacterized protein n=1 Tax=uncultured bacterium fosmid pJB190D12_contig II TaxID=1478060 RepID=A0A0H3U9E5_9BACT|nr:hypothetical protein [uncultured bacterium fosmid pJB190D12_contig II]